MKKILLLSIMICLTACQAIPKNALVLSPEALQDRQIQTRKFETTDKVSMLIAATSVLQDLGFTIDETDTKLGVLVGKKDRDAISGSQIAGAIILAALTGVATPIDATQTIRVAMVMRESSLNKDSEKTKQYHVLTKTEQQKITQFLDKTIYEKLITYQHPKKSKEIAKLASKKVSDNLTSSLEHVLKTYSSDGDSIVRVTFQRVIVDTQGRVTKAEQIKDPTIYQQFFEKLSKSIFLEAHEI